MSDIFKCNVFGHWIPSGHKGMGKRDQDCGGPFFTDNLPRTNVGGKGWWRDRADSFHASPSQHAHVQHSIQSRRHDERDYHACS